MVDSDSELDLGNSDEESEENDNKNEKHFIVSTTSKKENIGSNNEANMMSAFGNSKLYTINEEEERETGETKNNEKSFYLTELELYFKQLVDFQATQVM